MMAMIIFGVISDIALDDEPGVRFGISSGFVI
jgi:hypothetical protein